ncbi:hypothetical protein C8R47DRAFT_250453 [Mycena vitilis]|nr:hypothetical protein C8R47DRAFT_250453 [Mycena vitilis]
MANTNQPQGEQQEELKSTPLDRVDPTKLTDTQKVEYEKLVHAAAENEKIGKEADKTARELREQADEFEEEDSPEREKLLEQAAGWTKTAAKYFAIAEKQQSGVWQGGVCGAGIGAGIGIGIGAFVGTLVGGIVTVPTTALGIAGGAATGVIHGPWITVTGKDRKNARGEGGEAAPEDEEENKDTGVENMNHRQKGGQEEGAQDHRREVGEDVKPAGTTT